ncbi:MAG TPA: tetratricopeptide repeat protein, partial [Acidobacteriaceae bacterium]|nr:tetratricopeptide repeat protein [Acidobacteriaceae bacterium]
KRLWTLEGMAYAGKSSPSEALKAYNHALILDARYLPALEGAAQIEYQRHSPAAKGLLQRILAIHPNDPTTNTMLGLLDSAAKDCEAAIAHFALGGAILASQPAALEAYATCLAGANHYHEAIPIFQQALDANPSTPSARYNLALAQWKANQPDAALATLQPALQNPQETDAILLAADIHEASGHTQQAIDLLRSAILANPKNVEPYLAFASLSYDHASMQVGIDILNAGLTQLPNEARLYQVRGILYIQLAKFDEAAADFAKASQLNPRLPMLGTAEALSASQQHNDADAIVRFRRAAKAQPHDALTHYLLAEALSLSGPRDNSPEAREEITAAKEACRLDPKMASCHNLLAGIYQQSGQLKLAADESRAALALDPNDPQAIYHLILAVRKTSSKAELAELLKRLTAARAADHEKQIHGQRFELQETPAPPPAGETPPK